MNEIISYQLLNQIIELHSRTNLQLLESLACLAFAMFEANTFTVHLKSFTSGLRVDSKVESFRPIKRPISVSVSTFLMPSSMLIILNKGRAMLSSNSFDSSSSTLARFPCWQMYS